MPSEKEKFLELAYSFFPKSISDEDMSYSQTSGSKNLKHVLQEHNHLDDQWHKLLQILEERLECLDIGIPDRTKRCYRIAVIRTAPKRHYLVVNISKLIPYFCFYAHSMRSDLRISDPGYLIFSDFISSDQEIVEWITERIKEYFPGYSEFPPDLIFTELPDVVFEENGVLLTQQYKNYFRPMNLFNAFFSTHMFTD